MPYESDPQGSACLKATDGPVKGCVAEGLALTFMNSNPDKSPECDDAFNCVPLNCVPPCGSRAAAIKNEGQWG